MDRLLVLHVLDPPLKSALTIKIWCVISPELASTPTPFWNVSIQEKKLSSSDTCAIFGASPYPPSGEGGKF